MTECSSCKSLIKHTSHYCTTCYMGFLCGTCIIGHDNLEHKYISGVSKQVDESVDRAWEKNR